MLEQVPVRIDRELEIDALDRAPDRVAVDVHEHAPAVLLKKIARRIGLDALDVLAEDLARVDVWPARDRARSPGPRGERLVDLLAIAAIDPSQRREVGLRDLEVREADEPLGERDLRVGVDLDGAEGRLGCRRTLAEYATAAYAVILF